MRIDARVRGQDVNPAPAAYRGRRDLLQVRPRTDVSLYGDRVLAVGAQLRSGHRRRRVQVGDHDIGAFGP